MLLIIYTFIVELLFLGVIKNMISNWEVASIVFIGIHAIFVFIGIGLYNKNNWIILSMAYIIRSLAMFWDIYGRNVFVLIGSGGDSEGFLRSATFISQDLTLLKGYIYGGLYTKILGFISYIAFPCRILLQYINVLLGLFIILIVYRTLEALYIDSKVIKKSIFMISFLPISIIHSAILLRENIISFFIALSLYFFIKWYKKGNLYNAIASILLLGVASIFHSGVIGIVVGYIFALLFYNHSKNKFVFSFKTVIWFVLIIFIGAITITWFNHIFLGKFVKVTNIEDIMRTASGGRGSSQYLQWLNISNPIQLILFSPIKILYFLTSPLPTEWRGMGDIVAFLMDGLFYLNLIFFYLKNLVKGTNRNPIINIITLGALGVIFIFGIGLNNAGTAMRHRNKIIPILVILYALIADRLNTNKKIYDKVGGEYLEK